MKRNDLPITEELDFQYLLTLLPPLTGIPEYSWLPELFSIIGHDKLLLLSRYAGGETIRIPTLEELSHAIQSLQVFYNVYISKKLTVDQIPSEVAETVEEIVQVYSNVGHN